MLVTSRFDTCIPEQKTKVFGENINRDNYMHYLNSREQYKVQAIIIPIFRWEDSQRFRILPKVTHILRSGVTLLFIQEIKLLLQKKLTAQIDMNLYHKQLIHLTDIKIWISVCGRTCFNAVNCQPC